MSGGNRPRAASPSVHAYAPVGGEKVRCGFLAEWSVGSAGHAAVRADRSRRRGLAILRLSETRTKSGLSRLGNGYGNV